MKPLKSQAANLFYGLGALALGIGALGCLAALGVQVYQYLRNGFWVPMPAMTTLGELLGVEWMRSPMDWVGVHNMLNDLNAGAVFFFLGLAAWWFFFSIAEDMKRTRNEHQNRT